MFVTSDSEQRAFEPGTTWLRSMHSSTRWKTPSPTSQAKFSDSLMKLRHSALRFTSCRVAWQPLSTNCRKLNRHPSLAPMKATQASSLLPTTVHQRLRLRTLAGRRLQKTSLLAMSHQSAGKVWLRFAIECEKCSPDNWPSSTISTLTRLRIPHTLKSFGRSRPTLVGRFPLVRSQPACRCDR